MRSILFPRLSQRCSRFFSRSLSTSSKSLEAKPLTGCLGAEITGLDLSNSQNLEESVFDEIRKFITKYHVLFFRDQDVNPKSQLAFAKRLKLGPVEPHPIVKGLPEYPDIIEIIRLPGKPTQFGETWHTDNSYQIQPTSISILHSKEVPPHGNDTVWTNMNAVYESLSPGLKKVLLGLKGVHTAGRAFSNSGEREVKYADGGSPMKYQKSNVLDEEVLHPVVRSHPISGLKSVYVNSMFTIRFDGWTEEESLPLLQYLFAQVSRPEFQCRFRWTPKTLALWDNRTLQHMAINDILEFRRVMHRVTLQGEKPFGPDV